MYSRICALGWVQLKTVMTKAHDFSQPVKFHAMPLNSREFRGSAIPQNGLEDHGIWLNLCQVTDALELIHQNCIQVSSGLPCQ